MLEQEPAWARFRGTVLEFLNVGGRASEDPAFALSTRERQILVLIVEGLRSDAPVID